MDLLLSIFHDADHKNLIIIYNNWKNLAKFTIFLYSIHFKFLIKLLRLIFLGVRRLLSDKLDIWGPD